MILKFHSNVGGQLAQGKIGEEQFMDIGTELDKIRNSDDYTKIVILHHHPVEIDIPGWYERDWYEKILGDMNIERTTKLVDHDIFLEWLRKRRIRYVLHGHKHIPKYNYSDGIHIVAAGSSTGMIKHIKKGRTYLSFNVIKYDVNEKKPVSCEICYEEILGSGIEHLQAIKF